MNRLTIHRRSRGKTHGARVRLSGAESETLRQWLAGEYVPDCE